jgi:hypothetical protein
MTVGILIATFAIAFAGAGFWEMRRARAQHDWPQVPGTITRSAVTLGRGFMPDVEALFAFDGRVYRSTQVASHEISLAWPSSARRTVARYPVGKAVTVYVDAKNPQNSVLEPGGDEKFLVFILSMSAFMLFAGLRIAFTA